MIRSRIFAPLPVVVLGLGVTISDGLALGPAPLSAQERGPARFARALPPPGHPPAAASWNGPRSLANEGSHGIALLSGGVLAVLGLPIGALAGGVLYELSGVTGTREDPGLLAVMFGAVMGSAGGAALGLHYGNGRRGDGFVTGTAAASGALGTFLLGLALHDAHVVLATPLAALAVGAVAQFGTEVETEER